MSSLLERYERDAVLLDDPMVEARRWADIDELARREAAGWKPRSSRFIRDGDLVAAGGQFYHDTRGPFNTAAYPSVTLATTSKMLYPANPNVMVQPWEWFPGKKIRVIAFGQITTAATPGNLTIELRAATADAGGTLLATSNALTLIASQTTKSWRCEFSIECWSTGNGGASGSLFASGVFEASAAVFAAGQALIPDGANAAVTVDLQAAVGLSLQFKRSGSTAETAQVFRNTFVHES